MRARSETWNLRVAPEDRPVARTADLLFLAGALLVLAITAVLPEVRQDQGYHVFADRRILLGVPNALDVLSNAAFAVVGAQGLSLALRPGAFADPRERPAWLVLFAAVGLTSLGSAYYHLAPSDARLVWDRLPMAAGFMALVAALLGERFGVAVGRHLLGRLVLAGIATVAYWDLTGNLLPYLLVQYGTMAAIPLMLAGRPARAGPATPWIAALVLYAAAKVLETNDGRVFLALGVSGHTLKHLVAAAAIGVLALEIRRRGRREPELSRSVS
jgi:hypothetical protein